MIQVIVNGAKGRMGQETVKAVRAAEGLELVGALDLGDDLARELAGRRGTVVVDFTHPSSAYPNAMTILEAGCHGVIGTTGFTEEQIDNLALGSVSKPSSAGFTQGAAAPSSAEILPPGASRRPSAVGRASWAWARVTSRRGLQIVTSGLAVSGGTHARGPALYMPH